MLVQASLSRSLRQLWGPLLRAKAASEWPQPSFQGQPRGGHRGCVSHLWHPTPDWVHVTIPTAGVEVGSRDHGDQWRLGVDPDPDGPVPTTTATTKQSPPSGIYAIKHFLSYFGTLISSTSYSMQILTFLSLDYFMLASKYRLMETFLLLIEMVRVHYGGS